MKKAKRTELAASDGSASYVRIWNQDDDGAAFVHLVASGKDNTICGHDFAGDSLIHARDPEHLFHRARVTCPQCLSIIADVREHLKPNK